MLAQQAFSTDFLLMWKWGESKGFDVATDSTQIMPSCHALKLAWGEHPRANTETEEEREHRLEIERRRSQERKQRQIAIETEDEKENP